MIGWSSPNGTAQSALVYQTCCLTQQLWVVSWLWLSPTSLRHWDIICIRTSHGWLITSYLPWPIRGLIEPGLVTKPFLSPWKAWPELWVLPCDEWLDSGPHHAVGGPLFPWLMAFGCWTASRRSLLHWSDSTGDCQSPLALASSTYSCGGRGHRSKTLTFVWILKIAHCRNFTFMAQIIS